MVDVNWQRAGFATDARDRQLNSTKAAAADNTAPAEHNRRYRRQKPARRNQTMKRKHATAESRRVRVAQRGWGGPSCFRGQGPAAAGEQLGQGVSRV